MRRIVLCTALIGFSAIPPTADSAPRNAPPRATESAVVDRAAPSYTDHVLIHFHAEGRGSPAIVFIHCLSCDGSDWDRQVPVFAKSRRVVVLDLAGHGKSGGDRAAWTMKAFAGDVKTVVEALHLRRVVLVGHSMGGIVALEAARIMPERVAAVIGVDTLQDADQKRTPEQIKEFLRPLEADFRGATTAAVRQLFGAEADPALVEQVAAKAASARPGPTLAMLKELLSYDLAAGLAAVRSPIRCIDGDKFPTNIEGNRKYAPTFAAVIVKGAGHFPQLEKPSEFNDLLARTLEEVAPVKR